MVESVKERLQAAGREATPEGAVALHLARMLAEGAHTASGAAALAGRLLATLAAATAGAAVSADGVDDLKDRRERRRRGA